MDSSELAQRIRTVGQVADVVQAMRTLASARLRQAQDRFSGLERYAAATRSALSQALALLGSVADRPGEPPLEARRVVALFSEHGFVGALNDTLLDHALSLSRARGAQLIVAGARGQRLCRERNVEALDGGAMPTTIGGAQATAQRLVQDLFGAIAEGRIAEIHLVFGEHRPPVGWRPRSLLLFPPEVKSAGPSSMDVRPLHTLAPDVLLARAVEEYAFSQVSWAVSEAFASEQAARFAAMDASHRHTDDKLAELRAIEREQRQEATTNEILEIVSGSQSSGSQS